MKKGQVAFFMVVGIVIIIIVLFFMYLTSQSYQKISGAESESLGEAFDVQPIKLFVEGCIKEVSYDALYFLGRKGGSIEFGNDELVTSYSIIDYLYDKGENKVPEKQEMEEQLSIYVKEMLDSCLNNFTAFEAYDFSYGEINVNSFLGEKDVLFDVNYPIKIKSGDTVHEISEFSIKIPVRLNYIRKMADSIVENQLNDPGWVDITYMSDFGVNFTIFPYNETVLVYGIIDNESLVYNEPYLFLFANRFEDE